MCIKVAFYQGRNHLHPSLYPLFLLLPSEDQLDAELKRLCVLSSYSLMLVGTIAIASGNGVVK